MNNYLFVIDEWHSCQLKLTDNSQLTRTSVQWRNITKIKRRRMNKSNLVAAQKKNEWTNDKKWWRANGQRVLERTECNGKMTWRTLTHTHTQTKLSNVCAIFRKWTRVHSVAHPLPVSCHFPMSMHFLKYFLFDGGNLTSNWSGRPKASAFNRKKSVAYVTWCWSFMCLRATPTSPYSHTQSTMFGGMEVEMMLLAIDTQLFSLRSLSTCIESVKFRVLCAPRCHSL